MSRTVYSAMFKLCGLFDYIFKHFLQFHLLFLLLKLLNHLKFHHWLRLLQSCLDPPTWFPLATFLNSGGTRSYRQTIIYSIYYRELLAKCFKSSNRAAQDPALVSLAQDPALGQSRAGQHQHKGGWCRLGYSAHGGAYKFLANSNFMI